MSTVLTAVPAPIPTPLALDAEQIKAMLARCRRLGGERFAADVLAQLAELAKRGDV